MDSPPRIFSREQLLARRGLRRFTTVDIAGLGCVRLRSLTERERARVDLRETGAEDEPDRRRAECERRAAFIAACVVNAEGVPLYDEEDIPELAELDAGEIAALFSAIQTHCVPVPSAKVIEKN